MVFLSAKNKTENIPTSRNKNQQTQKIRSKNRIGKHVFNQHCTNKTPELEEKIVASVQKQKPKQETQPNPQEQNNRTESK